MKIIVSVIDGVYGSPAAGVEVNVRCETAGELSSHLAAGLTDSRGEFSYFATGQELSSGEHCNVRLDVDAYFTSLGIVAGYKEIALMVRVIDGTSENRVITLITPFAHTTWIVRRPDGRG